MDFRQNFRALQAFEAVSRHLSVSHAASELGVTQSAVSHQLRLLTNLVGENLLRKQGRGVALTEAGARLAVKLQEAFTTIDRSVSDVIGKHDPIVRLAVCSSFGPGWLVPRLADLYASKPGFDLHLQMYARDPELSDAVADAFVTTLPNEKGFFSLLLWPEKLVPVLSPSSERHGTFPLITTDLAKGKFGNDWKLYAKLAGKNHVKLPEERWLFASHYVTALEMVRAGLGAALVPDFLIAREVEAGSLVLLDDTEIPTHEDYYLCVKETRRNEPALDALVRWFRSQISRQPTADALRLAAPK
ncbi:LysR family transcriptional regulator [Mesorhizobium sp. CAU 1741]|uniref:LysR family transcriptional regulator n=1 Tax=Mesorhizobium sp. CAU 1741 TaxID=3140366 RepID=UPI00325AE6F5